MADQFVSKLGNDGNDGLTLANAKLTVQAAINTIGLGSVGDIEIHSGNYKEVIRLGTGAKTFTGIGQVVMDGDSALASMLSQVSEQTNGHVFNNIEIRNYTGGANGGMVDWTINQLNLTFNNCRFIGSLAVGVWGVSNSTASSGPMTFNDCLFANLERGIRTTRNGNLSTIRRCTFDCSLACIGTLGTSSTTAAANFIILSSLFITDTGNCFNIRETNDNIISSEFNRFFVTGLGNVAFEELTSTAHATLVAWQGESRDLNSSEGDPLVNDRALGIYIPTTSSPLLGAGGPVGAGKFEDIGAFKKGFAISNNVNNALWTGAVLVDVVLNASNRYELDVAQTVGTIATDVLDMGATFKIAELRLVGIEDLLAGVGAGEVFDKTLADDDVTLEFRLSSSSFLKGDGTPAYQEFKRNEIADLTGRFIQWRVTLRNNGDLN